MFVLTFKWDVTDALKVAESSPLFLTQSTNARELLVRVTTARRLNVVSELSEAFRSRVNITCERKIAHRIGKADATAGQPTSICMLWSKR